MIKFMETADVKQFVVEYNTDDERREIKDALAELERSFSPVYTYIPSCDNNNDHYFLGCFDSLDDAKQAAQGEIEDRISRNATLPPYYTFYEMPFRLFEYEVYDHKDVLSLGKEVAKMHMIYDYTLQELS